MNKSKNVTKNGSEILDKGLKSVSGGKKSEDINLENCGVGLWSLKYEGPNKNPSLYCNDFNGEVDSICFNSVKEAEKYYNKKRGKSTNGQYPMD